MAGLGIGLAAAGAATAVGIAADQLSRRRKADLATLAPPGAYAHQADKELVVVTGDGIPLHVEIDEPAADTADPAHPTVVFSHGYCLSLRSWVLQRRELTRAGYRVVLWDQRSHGRSERAEMSSSGIDQLGQDLYAVIRETVPEGPLVLVGHSMGGMTMMALADQFPEVVRERVVAAAFVATSAGGGALTSLGYGEYVGKILSRLGPGLLARIGSRQHVFDGARRVGRDIEEFFVERYSFASPVPPAAVRFTADMIFQTPLTVMSDFLPTFDTHDKRHALDQFDGIEVLVLNGEEDLLTPPEHSVEIVRRVPGAEHVVVSDAGHIIMLEHPEVLNEQLLLLIERAKRAAEDGVGAETRPRVRRTVTDLAKRQRVARARRRGRHAT